MTTATTPAAAAIADLLECLDDGGLHFDGQPLPDAAAIELRRLQAENQRLRAELVTEARATADHKLRADQLAQQHRMQAQMHAQATQQLAELEASKNARIHELEMQALDLASENSILKRRDADELEARKPLPPMEAIKLGMEAQQACSQHSTITANWALAMTRFYERRLCGIKET